MFVVVCCRYLVEKGALEVAVADLATGVFNKGRPYVARRRRRWVGRQICCSECAESLRIPTRVFTRSSRDDPHRVLVKERSQRRIGARLLQLLLLIVSPRHVVPSLSVSSEWPLRACVRLVCGVLVVGLVCFVKGGNDTHVVLLGLALARRQVSSTG